VQPVKPTRDATLRTTLIAHRARTHDGICEIARVPHARKSRYVGTPTANTSVMTSTEGKAGFGLAWLIGIPLPILAIVYLITRC
jgi:hypothetical protein